MSRLHPRSLFVLKLLVCLLLLGGVWHIGGGARILDTLGQADPFWLVLGFALILPQTILSALRWRLVAARLGVAIPAASAVAEYYVAIFLNQVLPGGVAGDVTRAVRHGFSLQGDGYGKSYGVAAKAVVYERTAGQIAMVAMSIPGLALWRVEAAWLAAGILAALLGAATLIRPGGWIGRQLDDFRRAVLALDVVAIQLLFSGFIVVSYVVVFWFCVKSIGLSLTAEMAAIVLPPALLAMAIPITPAGWGLREAAAVGMWLAAGMDAGDAAAASILYGLVNLAGALPGAAFLLFGSRK